jgi:hypothetical protein
MAMASTEMHHMDMHRATPATTGQHAVGAALGWALSWLSPLTLAAVVVCSGGAGLVSAIGTGDDDGLTSQMGRDIAGMIPLMTGVQELVTSIRLRDLIVDSERLDNGREITPPPTPHGESHAASLPADPVGTSAGGDELTPVTPTIPAECMTIGSDS